MYLSLFIIKEQQQQQVLYKINYGTKQYFLLSFLYYYYIFFILSIFPLESVPENYVKCCFYAEKLLYIKAFYIRKEFGIFFPSFHILSVNTTN